MSSSISRPGIAACLFAAGLALSGSAAFAQDATTGSISGTVMDSTGAIIKGATVTITNTDRNQVERTLTTNSAGFYTATALPLGHYSVKVEDAGFTGKAVTGLMLNVSDALTVNETLNPGSSGEVVTVTADAAPVNLEDATSATLINSTQINELVMVTRNYESLINLMPGVSFGGATDNLQRGPVGVNGSSSVVSFSVNGGRNTSNNWTIDGADNLDRGANLTLYVYPTPDSIGQFKVLRGQYSAAYGRNSSGMVDVVTKSGTDQLHGSAYEYFRNDYLDANSYVNDYLGSRIPKYRYNDFGFSLGGPLYIPHVYDGRGKTFWFISENWLREITYNTATTGVVVPTPAEISGDFSNDWYKNTAGAWVQGPVNVCTAYTYNPTTQSTTCTAAGTNVSSNISATAKSYLKDIYSIIPANTPAQQQALAAKGLDPHGIYPTVANRYPNLDTAIRIDHKVGDKLNLLYRYSHDTFPEYIGAGTFVALPIPGLSGTISNNPGTQHLAKGTYTFSSTLVGNLGYAYSNGSIENTPQGGLLAANSPDINVPLPYTNTSGLVPTISVSGMQTIGGGAVYTDHGINHQAFGDLTKIWGTHTFIGGFSYNHYNKQENAASSGQQGSFSFLSDTGYSLVTPPSASGQSASVNEDQAFANFLIGNANGGFSQTSRNPKIDVSQNIWEAYLQDNWKATPRLTLNLGVRYSLMGQPWDAAGFMSNFDPSQYSDSKAPTISASGLICFTAPCSQTNSSAGQATTPNASADYVGPNYINGLIFGTASAANNNQASPYGNKVGVSQKTNFAPRVGFAYDLLGNGKVAVRGGYGWAFDQIEVSMYELTGIGSTYSPNPPAATTYSQTAAVLDNPSGGASSSTPSTTPGHLYAVPTDFKTPYLQQYSLGMQMDWGHNLSTEIGYIGTHGTHLAGQQEINQPKPGAFRGVVNPESASSTCFLGTSANPAFISSTCDRVLNQIKPYKGYYAIDALRTIFSSNYNALQATLTKRFNGKSYVSSSFTWSRDLTNAPADTSGFTQDIYNVNGDYGRAPLDRKLIYSANGVWDMPWFHEQHGLVGHVLGGWEASGIFVANSGLPLTVSASSGTAIQYGSGVTQPISYAGNPTNVINDNAGLAVLGSTNAGLRPNQVSNPNNGFAGHPLHPNGHQYSTGANPWFNTGAFVATDPTSNVPGTAKRGMINGPGFWRADVGIFRNFKIYDRLTFQFRGEAFNALNHVNVQTISVSSTATTFGQITGYRDQRILQLAGRFQF